MGSKDDSSRIEVLLEMLEQGLIDRSEFARRVGQAGLAEISDELAVPPPPGPKESPKVKRSARRLILALALLVVVVIGAVLMKVRVDNVNQRREEAALEAAAADQAAADQAAADQAAADQAAAEAAATEKRLAKERACADRVSLESGIELYGDSTQGRRDFGQARDLDEAQTWSEMEAVGLRSLRSNLKDISTTDVIAVRDVLIETVNAMEDNAVLRSNASWSEINDLLDISNLLINDLRENTEELFLALSSLCNDNS